MSILILIISGDYGLPDESVILCHQIRTLDKQRLTLMYGGINSVDKQNEIIEALCFQLGIDNRSNH